ncbi:hypothetical protein VIGAN_01444400 [Vigna angularis var. angularis]|uniref:Uncharacterized protein n=1 Tax=Vigna angularis var. angularis TaxID=157739 RepID=A0A0S3R718_PHAAN|nr:hypothetical protein VIGAN_01444400 [Vigna angularis var. angularis]
MSCTHSLFNFPTYLGFLIIIPITLFCLTISANFRDLLFPIAIIPHVSIYLGIFLFLNLLIFFLSSEFSPFVPCR